MTTQTTEGVIISVETFYQPAHSNVITNEFMFAYRITIGNQSPYTVQLLTRYWHIFDSNGSEREVTGEGVVGQQPILEPGESHTYVSGCHLRTDIGKMRGYYEMKRITDGSHFEVEIPEFALVAPFKLN